MNIPDGFQIKYFSKDIKEAEAPPTLAVANGVLYIPYFVTEETREGMGEDEPAHTVYTWLQVTIPYEGDNLEDPIGLKLLRYAAIRKFLYGKLENQLEMRDDRTWDHHWAAVRKAVRNPRSGNIRKWYSRYEALTAMQADEALFNQLFTLYRTNEIVNLWWNSVTEICLDDPKFKEIVGVVGLSEQDGQSSRSAS
jgi:hypothetical protein